MANQHDTQKEKFNYSEWGAVLTEIEKECAEMGEREGKEITLAEYYRRVMLEKVNKRRESRKLKPLTLDPASAPGGRSRSTQRRKNTHKKAA